MPQGVRERSHPGRLQCVKLAHYASVLGTDVDHLTLRAGQRHDVIMDHSAGVAWRFPRTAAALTAFPTTVARTRRARTSGLPAPEVVDVVTGPLGTARMGLTLLDGTGMSREVVEPLGPRARATLVHGLSALLGTLRSVEPVDWPQMPTSWSDRWQLLGSRLRTDVLPLIGSDKGRLQAASHVEAAEAAASGAGTYGLTHGDLGGENVLLDPESGELVGVLDWDDAVPGDPAVDLAAILAHAPDWLADGLFALDPSLTALARRAEAYLGTFALQQALWGVEAGEEAEVTDGLADYLALG